MTTATIFDANNRPGETCVNGFDLHDFAPVLRGSPKQVAWATQIIRDNYEALCREVVGKDTIFITDDKLPAVLARINGALAVADGIVARCDRAGWWIDHGRNGKGSAVLNLAGKADKS